jgi:hypothetical protein
MRKFEHNLPEAMEFEALDSRLVDGFFNKKLYAIAGRPGVYRRVARSGSGMKVNRKDAFMVVVNGSPVEMVPDPDTMRELMAAGFFPGSPQLQLEFIEKNGLALPQKAPPEPLGPSLLDTLPGEEGEITQTSTSSKETAETESSGATAPPAAASDPETTPVTAPFDAQEATPTATETPAEEEVTPAETRRNRRKAHA